MSHGSSRIAALDGLRAVSILLVLISHAWLGHIVPGGLGVTIFFFISGFIITRLMISEWDTTGSMRISHFYIRRFFRLMPALTVFIFLSVLTLQLAGHGVAWKEILAVFLYTANYYGIFIGFSGDTFPPPLAITWSLAVEEHFYLIFPSLFVGLIVSWKRFVSLIVGVLVIVLCWRCWLAYGVGLEQLPHYRIYKATDTRVDSILYGTLLAVLLARKQTVWERLNNMQCFAAGAVIILATLLIRSEEFRESLRYSLQGLALFLLFPYAVLSNSVISQLLSNRFFLYVGKISYSLYLYHWLAFGIVVFWMGDAALIWRILAMTLLSFVMADLSYRCVENPGLRTGRKFLKS